MKKIRPTDFYDGWILKHNFAKNGRDYEFLIETMYLKPSGIYSLRFTHVYELKYITTLNNDTLTKSKDDVYLDHDEWSESDSPAGQVWGVNYSVMEPGFAVLANSKVAEKWTIALGMKMSEIHLETNKFEMTFCFNEYIVEKVDDVSNTLN